MKRLKVLIAAMSVALLLSSVPFGAALASDTQLNPAHVNAMSAGFTEACDGSEGLAPGQVFWHFVLTQTTDVNTGLFFPTITGTTIVDTVYGPVTPGGNDFFYYKHSGKTLHWGVITTGDGKLEAAYTTAMGTNLNFSHVCHGTPGDTGELHVRKFFDANANGIFDGTDVFLIGWLMDVNGVTYPTDVDLVVNPGNHTVTELASIIGTWVHSASILDGVDQALANPVVASVPLNGSATVTFGNYCLVGSGGMTRGFWHNKNGAKVLSASGNSVLNQVLALNLRNADGSLLGNVSLATFQSWLTSANASNMANMLSAQLAAMKANVASGKSDGNAFVLGFGGTVNQLIAAANASLALYGNTTSPHPQRAYQGELKDYLDDLNNGGTVIPASPCDFAF